MFRKVLIVVGFILIVANILVNAWIVYWGEWDRLNDVIAWMTFGFFYSNMLEDIED